VSCARLLRRSATVDDGALRRILMSGRGFRIMAFTGLIALTAVAIFVVITARPYDYLVLPVTSQNTPAWDWQPYGLGARHFMHRRPG
jgi:hypothetical protein